MYTSIVLAALMSPGAAGPQVLVSEKPTWQTDYSAARKEGQEQNKPLAVFIGSGAQGWKKVSRENELTSDALRTLAESYVCVYVDATSPAGKSLADNFSLTQGLVVSSRDGQTQAFRHSGPIAATDLDTTLRRYSNGHVSLLTETLEEADGPKEKPKGAPAAGPAPALVYTSCGAGGCPVSAAACGAGGCPVSYAGCGTGGCSVSVAACGGGCSTGCGMSRGCRSRGCGGRRCR